jgi:putative tricarboxylic transport membrane protein
VLGPAIDAFGLLLEPVRLLALFGGMISGLVIGMLPGLGGVAAVSILLPFVYALDAYAGLAMLLGAVSVVYTSDTITSVLVGTPGSRHHGDSIGRFPTTGASMVLRTSSCGCLDPRIRRSPR